MKNIILFTAFLLSCIVTSCGSNDEKTPLIDGKWNMNDTSLERRMNYLFNLEMEKNVIVHDFEGEGLVMTVAPKEDPSNYTKRLRSTYSLKGDSIFINEYYGGITRSKVDISYNVLTIYKKMETRDVKAMAEYLGMAISIPDSVKGEMKIKDYR